MASRLMFSLILIIQAVICLSFPQALAQTQPNVFLVKPYLQLGNRPDGRKEEAMDIVWFTQPHAGEDRKKLPGDWKVEYKVNEEWKPCGAPDTERCGSIGAEPYFRHTATVSDLEPGQPFSYRISQKKEIVFSGNSIARKNEKQPFRFAVVGDIGAGSSGQKGVVHQLLKKKPDFLMIPGDVVYDRGRVSEYLSRFFPIMNCDNDSPTEGAPLLRSVPTFAALGNHDIALTPGLSGVDLTAFPDALGYFIFWSQPLNGPNRVINTANSTHLKGTPQNQLNFVKAAGKRFPVMANYSFDYGNSHWIVIDGNEYMDWTNKKLRDWLEDDLTKNKSATWKFACYHQPAFSVDEAHAEEQRMRLVSEIFEKHGVDIVFGGHAHCYQRTFPLKFKPDLSGITGPIFGAVPGAFTLDKKFDGKSASTPQGVIYVTTGGGGAKLYRRARGSELSPYVDKFIVSHSFTICDIKDNNCHVSQVGGDGKVLDQFTITKPLQTVK